MMKLLAIETSCDETAVAVLECTGDEESASFIVQSHALISQIDIHREFGGVFPAIAKREHAKNLVPLLGSALEEAELLHGRALVKSLRANRKWQKRLCSLLLKQNAQKLTLSP
jgi:tRNA A37 threonylcarbamoyltransferase TsaD